MKWDGCAASAILREDEQWPQSAALWSACLEAQQAWAFAGTMLRAQQHNTAPMAKTPARPKTSAVLNVLCIFPYPQINYNTPDSQCQLDRRYYGQTFFINHRHQRRRVGEAVLFHVPVGGRLRPGLYHGMCR